MKLQEKIKSEVFLWVSNQINLDIGCKPNKVKQYSRFHMPKTVFGILKVLLLSLFKPFFLDGLTI